MDLWVKKIPWRRKWQHTPVFLPIKSHGQRNLVGYSPWGHKVSDMTEWLTTQAYTCIYIYMYIYTHTYILSEATFAIQGSVQSLLLKVLALKYVTIISSCYFLYLFFLTHMLKLFSKCLLCVFFLIPHIVSSIEIVVRDMGKYLINIL